MTEQELIRRLAQERPALPEGFEARHDGLLRRLTGEERRVSMKKIMAVALAALMLLGSVAYAATHIDLGALWNHVGQITQEQASYVNAAAQTPEITQVHMGGESWMTDGPESLTSVPVTEAYIGDITALAEQGEVVIGFTAAATGKDKAFTIGSVVVDGTPCMATLREGAQGEQAVWWLRAHLPSDMTGGAMAITLPLKLAEGKYQLISFNLAANDVTATAPVELAFDEHYTLRLGAGSLSPLGLCIPMEIQADQRVLMAGGCSVSLDGGEKQWAIISIRFEDMADSTLDHTLEIIAEWVEVGEETDTHHRGRAVLRLDDMAGAKVYHGVKPVQQQAAAASPLPYHGQPHGEDVTPLRMTFRAREMTMEELMALAEDVVGDTSGLIGSKNADPAESIGMWWHDPEAPHQIASSADYIPGSASLILWGREVGRAIRFTGPDAARDCQWTAQEATDMALAWVEEKLGIAADAMEVVEVLAVHTGAETDSWDANADGYLVALNQVDAGMPRLLRSNGNGSRFAREWEIMVKDRGICQCHGTLWELVSTEEVPDALTARQAQDILEAAWTDGSLGLPEDAWITDVGAASMKEEAAAYGECVRVPVWDFRLADSAGHIWQLCVDRATGEIIPMNGRYGW